MHPAHARRQFKGAQNIAHGVAIQGVIAVSTFRLAGGNYATPVLSRQLVSPGPLAKPRLNTRSSHSFSSAGQL